MPSLNGRLRRAELLVRAKDSQRAAKKKKLVKKFLVFAIVVLSFVAAPAIAWAQEKQPPSQFKMVEFHMALLKRGPNWSASGMTKELQSAHVA